MSNKNLFKEAIADAKAVREAALANAKAALEEALTPKLQSMLAAKLNEIEYEEEGLEETKSEDEMEEGFVTNQFNWNDEDNSTTDQNKLDENEELEEDFDLSEILAELDEDNSLEEAKKEEDEKKKKKMMKEADDESEESEKEEEEESVADMTIEDLKALIQDIVAQETGGGEGGEEGGEEMPMDTGGEEESDEEEINLDELLAELDALDEADDKEEMEEAKKKAPKKEKEEMKEGLYDTIMSKLDAVVGGGDPKVYKQCREELKSQKLGFEEHIRALQNCVEKKAPGSVKAQPHTAGQAFGVRENSEMKEALETINTLRSELNEVNLLNAKLLYVNKIFKAKNLSESQKLQVIASFDKATTAKEAKVVYESLNATLTATAPKKQIKESLGFASKAAGVAPKKAIVESNDVISRMQKLANIIK